MPTTTRTVFLTDENGNALIDEKRNMRTLSFSLVQGFSYRLVERASIVSATYAQVVGYSTATGQTISGVENASEFDVGDFGIVQYAISDRNNTIGYVTCEVTAVGTDSLTVNGIGISVSGADGADGKDGAPGADGKDGAATIQIGTVTTGAAGSQASVTNSGTENAAVFDFTIPQGADGASGVTDVTAGTPTEQDGYTVTPVTFNFEQGNSKTVNIQAKNGEGAGVQQNAIINRTASVTTADADSPDFVENNGDLWVKKFTGYSEIEVTTLEATLPFSAYLASAATAPNGKIYVFGGYSSTGNLDEIVEFDLVAQSVTTLSVTLPSTIHDTSAATAPNGKIYVFGGFGNSRLDDIIEFDPVTQTVTTLESTLPSARQSTSAATAPNGKIYVFGGYSRNQLNDIIEFDPVTQTVTTLESTLPSAREITSAATAPNGKIYVFGGIGNDYLDDIVEFDPVAQNVTTLGATLSRAREGASAATAPNGKIYVFGGYNRTYSDAYLDDIVEFVPSVAQYAYSPAVVLSQAEYTQLKNILQGVFTVGISAPSAEINGAVTASSFNATT